MSAEDGAPAEAPAVEATPPTRTNGRWSVRVGRRSEMVNPADGTAVDRVARKLGVESGAILDAIEAAQARAEEGATPAPPEPFVVRAWGGEDPRATFSHIEPLQALDDACQSRYAYLAWDGTDRLCAVDVDVYRNEPARGRFTNVDVEPAVRRTGADRGWLSKSGGLRLVFGAAEGLTAAERALLGLALGGLPVRAEVEQVEVKADTRRPRGVVVRGGVQVSALIGRACGQRAYEVPENKIAEWLAERGMERGQNYEHTHCPIDPSPSTGNPPVAALEHGVFCLDCASTRSGFRSWAMLIDHEGEEVADNPLVVAAREWVHLAHARLMLQTVLHRTAWKHADIAWRAMLKAVHAHELRATDDEVRSAAQARFAGCMDPNKVWVRSEGGQWLDADTFEAVELDRVTATALPWSRNNVDRVARARTAAPLPGFVPLRAFRAVVLRPEAVPPTVIPAVAPNGPRLRLTDAPDPDAVEHAWAQLEQDLPGVSRCYVEALLAAAAYIEPGCQPPMIYAYGPTGAAKTAHVTLAAGLLGSPIGGVPRKADEEDWKRQIGRSLASGARFLLADECAGLTWHDGERLRTLGEGGGRHTYRPLHGVQTSVPWRAVLVCTGRTVPAEWQRQPELNRRMCALRLPTRVPEWRGRGFDLQDWRGFGEDGINRGPLADLLVSAAVQHARRRGWSWDTVAQDLGLVPIMQLDPAEDAMRVDLLRALYQHLRGEDGARAPSRSVRWPAAVGWVDLGSPRAQAILTPLLPNGEHARYALTNDLNGEDWERVLGLPGVRLEVRERGNEWVARAVGRRPGGPGGVQGGAPPLNEALPSIG